MANYTCGVRCETCDKRYNCEILRKDNLMFKDYGFFVARNGVNAGTYVPDNFKEVKYETNNTKGFNQDN